MNFTTVTLELDDETIVVGVLMFNGLEWSFKTTNEPTTEMMSDIKGALRRLADKLETEGF